MNLKEDLPKPLVFLILIGLASEKDSIQAFLSGVRALIREVRVTNRSSTKKSW